VKAVKPGAKTALQWAGDLERICAGNEPLLGWAASLIYSRYFGRLVRGGTRDGCPLRQLMALYRHDHVLTDEDLRPALLAAGCDPKYVAEQCRDKVTTPKTAKPIITHGARRSGRVQVTAGVREPASFSQLLRRKAKVDVYEVCRKSPGSGEAL